MTGGELVVVGPSATVKLTLEVASAADTAGSNGRYIDSEVAPAAHLTSPAPKAVSDWRTAQLSTLANREG